MASSMKRSQSQGLPHPRLSKAKSIWLWSSREHIHPKKCGADGGVDGEADGEVDGEDDEEADGEVDGEVDAEVAIHGLPHPRDKVRRAIDLRDGLRRMFEYKPPTGKPA